MKKFNNKEKIIVKNREELEVAIINEALRVNNINLVIKNEDYEYLKKYCSIGKIKNKKVEIYKTEPYDCNSKKTIGVFHSVNMKKIKDLNFINISEVEDFSFLFSRENNISLKIIESNKEKDLIFIFKNIKADISKWNFNKGKKFIHLFSSSLNKNVKAVINPDEFVLDNHIDIITNIFIINSEQNKVLFKPKVLKINESLLKESEEILGYLFRNNLINNLKCNSSFKNEMLRIINCWWFNGKRN